MLEMVLFHHHSSIYNKDWSKPGFGRVCSNPCILLQLKASKHFVYFVSIVVVKFTFLKLNKFAFFNFNFKVNTEQFHGLVQFELNHETVHLEIEEANLNYCG